MRPTLYSEKNEQNLWERGAIIHVEMQGERMVDVPYCPRSKAESNRKVWVDEQKWRAGIGFSTKFVPPYNSWKKKRELWKKDRYCSARGLGKAIWWLRWCLCLEHVALTCWYGCPCEVLLLLCRRGQGIRLLGNRILPSKIYIVG